MEGRGAPRFALPRIRPGPPLISRRPACRFSSSPSPAWIKTSRYLTGEKKRDAPMSPAICWYFNFAVTHRSIACLFRDKDRALAPTPRIANGVIGSAPHPFLNLVLTRPPLPLRSQIERLHRTDQVCPALVVRRGDGADRRGGGRRQGRSVAGAPSMGEIAICDG